MKAFFVILLTFFTITAYSQTKEEKKQQRKAKIEKLKEMEEEGSIIFNKQIAFGIKLNTDGYGLFFELGKAKTTRLTNLWWLEIGEHKDKREQRSTNYDFTGYPTGNPFIYGKVNNFYEVKLGFNQQRLLGTKGTQNGVALSAIYGGGFAAALVKPYLLQTYDSTGRLKDLSFDDDYITFLDPYSIAGSSGFTKGWGKMSFVPGIHARAALRFDYGRYNETLSALEIGLNAMYYTKDIRIMADFDGFANSKHKFFLNGYVAFVFGKRK